MQITICEEDFCNLIELMDDNDIIKIASDKQAVWPFTIQEIIRQYREKDINNSI